MFPLADARGRDRRLPGAQAPRGRPAAGQVRQLARGRPLPQVGDPVRARPRPGGDREAGARGRRRGQHRRDRASPGRVRAGRRVDGDRADRPAAEGAAAADAAALPLLRRATQPARRRRCAGWSSRRRSASTSGSCTLPTGQDPADAPDGFEKRLVARRELRASIASGSSSTARPTARRRSCGCARSCSRNEDSPERQDALRLLAGRLDLPKETLAGLTPKGGTRTLDPGALAEDARDRRATGTRCAGGVRRPPDALPLLAEITPEHFESETHRRFRDQLLNGGDDGDLVGLKAELDARVAREGIDERHRPAAPAPPAGAAPAEGCRGGRSRPPA